MQVWGAISSRGISLQRKLNGNMDSTKYQSDIIHDIEIAYGYVVVLQKGCIFMHDLAPCHNTKSTRTFLECKRIPVLDWPGNWPDINPIANVWNIMQKRRFVTNCHVKKKICGSKYICEAWYSVAPKILGELNNSMPRSIADLIKAKECSTKY